jgi:hypothetical protein
VIPESRHPSPLHISVRAGLAGFQQGCSTAGLASGAQPGYAPVVGREATMLVAAGGLGIVGIVLVVLIVLVIIYFVRRA